MLDRLKRARFPARRARAQGLQWVALLVVSAAVVLFLERLHLPAALLLGPMVAGILVAVANGSVRVPGRPFHAAQGVIGCMIAHGIPLSITNEIARDWPLFMSGVFSVILASSVLGWLLTRWRVFPGTTAIWGSAPGAATAMTLMAEAFGEDVRLVAFMQYLRVVCVAVTASVVARLWTAPSSGPSPALVWFPPIALIPFCETLALIGASVFVARRFRIPAGPLLVPLVLGVVLQDLGWIRIELPLWLLAISYGLVGCSIGLRFTRPILVHAARALPRVVASIMTLIAICGLFAAVLVKVAGIDPLTAYLATSPGGADTVAIIAASSHVDLPFVMAMQTARLIVVLLTGPSLARFIAGRARAPAAWVASSKR